MNNILIVFEMCHNMRLSKHEYLRSFMDSLNGSCDMILLLMLYTLLLSKQLISFGHFGIVSIKSLNDGLKLGTT